MRLGVFFIYKYIKYLVCSKALDCWSKVAVSDFIGKSLSQQKTRCRPEKSLNFFASMYLFNDEFPQQQEKHKPKLQVITTTARIYWKESSNITHTTGIWFLTVYLQYITKKQ